ncbi:MAG: hypothetical protein M3Z54_06105 [Gemmatimonadota bacterium]|nr:hypothetical protein [Gemmatimonadota bacterium]
MTSIPFCRNRSGVPALCAALLLSLGACGSDSTGPAPLDPNAALQSLTLGISSVAGATSIYGPSAASLTTLGSQIGQVNITVNGKSQSMFALGVRETYPTGTCVEKLISNPSIPAPAGQCTPPPIGVVLLLWQSHSANAAPDRMALIVGNAGPNDFAALPALSGAIRAFALYSEGESAVWASTSGNLTSTVTATNQTCALPLPPFAKTGSCALATFIEQGTINFQPFIGNGNVQLEIPSQTIHGIWQTITETQPITVGSWDY